MLNLQELTALSQEEFTKVIGPVFEHSAWIAEKTWLQRPFTSREHLHKALKQTILDADDSRKLELIRAHPDLGARMKLTNASRREQASAAVDQLPAEEMALFDNYNREYRQKFGFPFVICARLNNKQTILAAFRARLQNSPEAERQTALNEIFTIADLRLREILE